MSTLAEHIARLRELKAAMRPLYSEAQQAYQSEAYLTVEAHLEEIAALVNAAPSGIATGSAESSEQRPKTQPSAPAESPKGCFECAYGKVAGCWRCGSR
jgi:hypothetical protein